MHILDLYIARCADIWCLHCAHNVDTTQKVTTCMFKYFSPFKKIPTFRSKVKFRRYLCITADNYTLVQISLA